MNEAFTDRDHPNAARREIIKAAGAMTLAAVAAPGIAQSISESAAASQRISSASRDRGPLGARLHIFYEIFATREAFEAHNNMPYVKEWFAKLPALADGGVKVTRMEILSGTAGR